MPIDSMILNPMFDPFRNMLEDCKSKNISGEHFDNMVATMQRLEQLGQEHSDMNAFNAQVVNENLYADFSNHYSRALSEQAATELNSDDSNFSDEKLLKSVLDALKNSIAELKRSYQEAIDLAGSHDPKAQVKKGLEYLQRTDGMSESDSTKAETATNKDIDKTLSEKSAAYDNSVEVEILSNPEKIISAIQALIDLGEQEGMTLPHFLRLQIEKGLDKAAEGAVVVRDGLEYLYDFSKASMISPLEIEKSKQKFEIYDELAAKNKFGRPNTRELSMLHDNIDREFEPPIREWKKIKEFGEKLIGGLEFWSLAYCHFAPRLWPWSLATNPKQAVIDSQKKIPGIFREREKLFKKYFNLDFFDIFKHETFLWDVTSYHMNNSQEYTEFLALKVYEQCQPFQDLTPELIKERESFNKLGPNGKDREGNPEIHLVNRRLEAYYDSKFGEGRYASKFDVAETSKSVAAPWDLNTFKLK